MKILFITPYPIEGASTRHRIVVYFPFLKKNAIEYTLSPFMSQRFYRIVYKKGFLIKKIIYFILGFLLRIYDILRCWRYDVVFIHLEAFPLGVVFFERALKKINRNIVYDLDDAIFLKNVSHANSFLALLKSGDKYKIIIKMAKGVISCNDYLEDYARSINSKANHVVIHTPLNTDEFKPMVNKNNKRLLIGWVGSYSTSKYLDLIKEPLIKLSSKFDFELNVVGAGEEICWDGLKINNIAWTLEKDIENFQILDIGIYPLPDNEWVKGKTGFKTMQYMSVGVPCVVSAVGANLKIVENGKNGFLAYDKDDWYEKLKSLLEDSELRKKIGHEGRKSIIENYSSIRAFKKLSKVLEMRGFYEKN